MLIEFDHTSAAGNLAAIAEVVGIPLQDGILQVPSHWGTGYVQEVIINPQLLLLIRQYELKEELVLKRNGRLTDGRNLVVIAFHNLYRSTANALTGNFSFPAVQVTTAENEYEDFFPSRSKVNTFIIMIHIDLLKELLDLPTEGDLPQLMLSGRHSFLFEQLVSPEMQQVADELLNKKIPGELRSLFYRVRIEELILLLFTELIKREHLPVSPINRHDAKIIYDIRDKIIADLSVNPNLTELAKFSGMSESKIKRLFRQIFGDSVYNYYQTLRMDRAAYLIGEQRLSVSEAGYQLGFANLSHFTRLFERYKGAKPKKYAQTR